MPKTERSHVAVALTYRLERVDDDTLDVVCENAAAAGYRSAVPLVGVGTVQIVGVVDTDQLMEAAATATNAVGDDLPNLVSVAVWSGPEFDRRIT